ncbi:MULTISPECIES: diguanylate cyclase [unclassified Agarivorans]|uniref:diguanylate cyclase n=1 Tax=unclassified Agarivorans TaxID=2636026 RepID=UPI003D7D56BD
MAIKTGSLGQALSHKSTSLSNEILAAILNSAEDLITGQGWLDKVNVLLEELGKVTSVSRVWIFQTLDLQDDYILQDYVFEWAAAEKYVQIKQSRFNYFKSMLKEPEYSELVESRKRGEYQQVLPKLLPESWLKSHLESQQVLSMLTIPIIVENRWWGTLGLDDCEREYDWSLNEITLLKTASYFISSAVVRDNFRAKKHQLDILKQNMACSSWEFDRRRGYLWCSSEVLSSSSEVVRNQHFTPREWMKRIHPAYRKQFLKDAREYFRSQGRTLRCDLKIMKNDGSYCWIDISANLSTDSTLHDSSIAGICWDISERKQQEQQLLLQATTDPLTGLMNRRKMESQLQILMYDNAQRQQNFSLAVLDIDHFKQVNDRHGHSVGDQVLQHFAKVCHQSLRKQDYFARVGGEEFVVLLPNTGQDDADSICQRICETIRSTPFANEQGAIQYSVSIGFTTLSDASLNAQQMIDAADRALYQAKQTGRAKVVSSQALEL